MGCNQSKIENEEAVSRCKERKQHMRNAVAARNAFAAAQTSYTVSLKNTGAALSDFASGESLFPHLHPHLTHSTSAPSFSSPIPIPPEPPSFGNPLPPPPPPIPADMDPPPAPLQRAQSMPQLPSSKAAPQRSETIVEEEEEEEEVESEAHSLKRRSSGRRGAGVRAMDEIPPPPTPPRETPPPPVTATLNRAPPSPLPGGETWDYFFNVEDMPGGSLGAPEEVNREREEYERKVFDESSKRAEMSSSSSSRVRKMEDLPPKVPDKVADKPPLPPQEVGAGSGGKVGRKGKQQVVVSPAGGGGGGEVKRAGKTVSLVKIFSELDDRFLKASESSLEVSKLLEAARLHYHSSFANNCGHINHSERVMKVITWNRSFGGPLNSDTGKDDFDSEENETHATVLDKLLAWEKKLYDEVKAGEIMKFDYQRKVALLNKQKKRGASPETLEKTKAAVSRLHTRYIVDMQSLDSTVSEINRLRDEQLYPKLVALVDGMATMWDSMRIYHNEQANISEALKYVDISQCVKETSEQHFEQTEQLWIIVQGWHNHFDKMVSNQKVYIKDLNSWLKLNLIPIESNLKEKVSSPPRPPNPPIQRLLIAWNDFLEKLPEELAKGAIFSFAAVLNTILQQQDDELKMRARCEEARKDLIRKTHAFEEWYNKYTQKRSSSDEPEPDLPEDFAHDQAVIEREAVIETAKKRVEEEEAAYQKQCIQVREKCLTNLKNRLPELFRSLSEFAVACSEVYRDLRYIAREENNRRSS